jgi:hypothetical protein
MILMGGKLVPALLLIAALALAIPAVAASNTMIIGLETHRRYFSQEIGSETIHASFYLFGGDHIQWWQGGAVFIYNVSGPEAKAKIDTFTKGLMNLFKDVGFIMVAGTVKPVYARIVYSFDGVLEYEGFYFVDDNGMIIMEWAKDKPLVITIYSKAVINASTAQYLGRADWKRIKVNGGEAILWPEIEIPKPDKPMDLLVVPREGFTGITTEINNFYGNETRTRYLGGGPELYRIEPEWPGITLKDSGTFWDREPIIKVIYDESGRHVFLIDWYWHAESPT